MRIALILGDYELEMYSDEYFTPEQAKGVADSYGLNITTDPKVVGQFVHAYEGRRDLPSIRAFYAYPSELPPTLKWSAMRHCWIKASEYSEAEEWEDPAHQGCHVCEGTGRLPFDHPLASGNKHKCGVCGGTGNMIRLEKPPAHLSILSG